MTERWHVKTSDGGTIAVWIEGDGPPLVLVHGSVSDQIAFAPLIGELRDEVTIFGMDRRGVGASHDGTGYSAEREFSDVAAVVDAVAARTREAVVLVGHSWGASCALGTAGPAVPARFHSSRATAMLHTRYAPAVLAEVLRDWLK